MARGGLEPAGGKEYNHTVASVIEVSGCRFGFYVEPVFEQCFVFHRSHIESMNTGLLIVFLLIVVAIVLFVTELVSVDVTAIGLMVALIALQPWTDVSVEEGLRGFSNPATLTVLAMFMLSEGIRRTGAVQMVVSGLESFTSDSEGRSLGALMLLSGPSSGIVNNTPVVAILIPVARKLAENVNVSPSRFLMPLSFISMLGGTLTLIGTSSTILASDLSKRLIGRSITMFELTPIGVFLLMIGGIYLFTLGRYLMPDRIRTAENLVQEFDMEAYLTDVVVLEGSDLSGRTIQEWRRENDLDLDVMQVIRDGRRISEGITSRRIQTGDVLVIRANRETLMTMIEKDHLEFHGVEEEELPDHMETEAQPATTDPAPEIEDGDTFVEIVLLPNSDMVGQSIRGVRFHDRYDAMVLAIRRGGEVIRERMKDLDLKPGDTLLIAAHPDTVDRISEDQGLIVSGSNLMLGTRTDRIPIAGLIMGGVILLPALGLFPIVVSAFAGVLVMVLTGCLRMREAYESVSWDIIFLLAGLIPLGVAMENTGGDQFLADLLLGSASFLPHWGILLLMYFVTTVVTNFISNAASVILILPIAVTVAQSIGANPFSFIIVTTLASATAFITPVGYQTNLMVYGPGGYKFSDFARVGVPLQLLTGIAVTFGTMMIWGI